MAQSDNKSGVLVTDSKLDKQEIFDSEIAPIADKLSELCERHGMPAMVAVVYKHSNHEVSEGVWYQNVRNIKTLEASFQALQNLDPTEWPAQDAEGSSSVH